jgi:4-alpha-glucanotransferase
MSWVSVAGLWSGADLRTQQRLGLRPNEAGLGEIDERLRAMTGLPNWAKVHEVIVRAYQLLAEAPSVVVTATLEDALAVEERPNMPGTTAEWPNWSLALPTPLGNLETQALTRAVADTFRRRWSPQGSRRVSTGAP